MKCLMMSTRLCSVALVFALVACSSAIVDEHGREVGSAASAVGFACVTVDEADPNFVGYSMQAVTLEIGNATCGTGVCLVNHFQGRVTCPYGQEVGESDCKTTDGAGVQGPVCGQCQSRPPAQTVMCSCKCGNVVGGLSDGELCECPSGFSCEELVAVGPDAGAYCVRDGTQFETDSVCGDVAGFWAPQCDGLPAPP